MATFVFFRWFWVLLEKPLCLLVHEQHKSGSWSFTLHPAVPPLAISNIQPSQHLSLSCFLAPSIVFFFFSKGFRPKPLPLLQPQGAPPTAESVARCFNRRVWSMRFGASWRRLFGLVLLRNVCGAKKLFIYIYTYWREPYNIITNFNYDLLQNIHI